MMFLQIWCLVRDLFLICRLSPPVYILICRRKRRLWFFSSYKDTNPTLRVSPSWPYLNLISSPKPCFQIPSLWELGFQHMNLGGKLTFHLYQLLKTKTSISAILEILEISTLRHVHKLWNCVRKLQGAQSPGVL